MENSNDIPEELFGCWPNDSTHSLHTSAKVAFPNQRYFIAVLYMSFYVVTVIPQFLVAMAILHPRHIKHSCYKLMFIVSILDISNLTSSFFVSSMLSFFNVHQCTRGRWVTSVGFIALTMWFAYCAASMVLAFNRVLRFTWMRAATFLFSGERPWLWVPFIIAYALAINLTVKDPFYFYNPTAGEWNFYTKHYGTNYNHVCNNFFKFAFVSLSYATMIIRMRWKLKDISQNISNMELKLSVQAFICGLLAAFSTVGYLAITYLPIKDFPLVGVCGELLWASVHGGSAYIYLAMNSSVRSIVISLVRRKKSGIIYVSSNPRTSKST
uniref:G_PROTEIN_RECEP_F1_2 domain-containing protein n=1 Tax=Steinernema glaseri TaxID=37863 RepID=A0A1I7ZBV9_9BILA